MASWVYLHNTAWTIANANYPYRYHGSVHWAKDWFQYDARNWSCKYNANTTNSGYGRLGLGNLSFKGNTQGYSYNQTVIGRYENIKVAAKGNAADTLNMVAYFDNADESRSIVFWRFHEGTSINNGDKYQLTSTTKSDLGITANRQGTYTGGSNVGIETPKGREELTSGGADTAHFDMSYDSNNDVVYIAYYDEIAGALKIRYLNNPAAGYHGRWTNTWQTAVTIDPDAAGHYVAMKTDASGRIHLAYYDTTGSYLKYALLTPSVTSGAVTGFTVTKKVLVDTLFTNGMYNSITLRQFGTNDVRPVITSYSISYGGTKYSLRTSWPLTTVENIEAGANTDSEYTGKWETVVVVSANAPKQDNTYTETKGTGYTGNIVVGYTASKLEQAELLGE